MPRDGRVHVLRPSASTAVEQCRLAFVSDDQDAGGDLLDEFEVIVVPFSGAEHELARVHCDVVLVDATGARRFADVASIAAAGTRGVVVVGLAGEPDDAMRYLDLGASDYVPLHSTRQELVARLRAVARTSATAAADDLLVGETVTISMRRREVRRNGVPVRLTPHEFAVLEALARQPGSLVPHRQLVANVWGPEVVGSRQHLRLYVRQLREKIEENPAAPSLILTERGLGYRLALDGPDDRPDAASA